MTIDPKNLRGYFYGRVSSPEQSEQGVSGHRGSQQFRVNEWATFLGMIEMEMAYEESQRKSARAKLAQRRKQ